jgi:hypothetical protein
MGTAKIANLDKCAATRLFVQLGRVLSELCLKSIGCRDDNLMGATQHSMVALSQSSEDTKSSVSTQNLIQTRVDVGRGHKSYHCRDVATTRGPVHRSPQQL